MTDNVVPLHPAEDARDPRPDEIKARRAFSALWARYLTVTARFGVEGLSDKQLDANNDKQCDLIWKLIRTPAPLDYHLNCKFMLLRETMGKGWTDGRHLALLESIRNDVLDPEEL